jgi:esterase/lipase
MNFISFSDVARACLLVLLGLIPAAIAERFSDLPDGALVIVVGVVTMVLAFSNMVNRWAQNEPIYYFFLARPYLVEAINKIAATGLNLGQLIDVLQANEQNVKQLAEQSIQVQKQNEDLTKQIEDLQKQNEDLTKQIDLVKKQAAYYIKQREAKAQAEIASAKQEAEQSEQNLQALKAKYSVLESGDIEAQYAFHRSAILSLNAKRPKQKDVKEL